MEGSGRARPKSGNCFTCGAPGHFARDCAVNVGRGGLRGGKPGRGGAYFTCGIHGHFARNCPQESADSKIAMELQRTEALAVKNGPKMGPAGAIRARPRPFWERLSVFRPFEAFRRHLDRFAAAGTSQAHQWVYKWVLAVFWAVLALCFGTFWVLFDPLGLVVSFPHSDYRL